MERKEVYDRVLNAFTDKYSWLGEIVGREFLLSAASYNIQSNCSPEFRVRRHLLLFWEAGWLKTSLLMKMKEILGNRLCTPILSDISIATLRGSVEQNVFISPYPLKRPFSICTDFGQIVHKETDDIIQKLLTLLEEGECAVSLGKIAYLSDNKREAAETDYGLRFVDECTFEYKTNWVLLAGTYNRRFLSDEALQSRFNVIAPSQKLSSALTKHLDRSAPFNLDEETTLEFQDMILDKSNPVRSTRFNLPDGVYNVADDFSPRDSTNIKSYILCSNWWGIKPSKGDVIDIAKKQVERRKLVWESNYDKIFKAIYKNPLTAEELVKCTNVKRRSVYWTLGEMVRGGTARKFTDDGRVKYAVEP